MQFNVEYTDTFGDEANYSWVRRHTFEAPDDASNPTLLKKAKALLGLTGMPGKYCEYGDMIEWRPSNMATVLFITW